MEKTDALNFKVGQLAEMKTFEKGYRCAWFRCKIRDILLDKNKIMPEYYDFPDEAVRWAKIYEVPPFLPYGKKSKHVKKQLMMRPHYPPLYHKSQMPPVTTISEVHVIINGTWKVGDLVDWHKDDCYWSARVINVLSNDKVQIELPMPPAGERSIEEPVLEASCEDLRPSLEWSPKKGWTLTSEEGHTPCNAQLVFPSNQGMKYEKEEVENAYSTSRISVNSLATPTDVLTYEQQVKMDDDVIESTNEKVSSSESISTLPVQETSKPDAAATLENNIALNINHEETLEATILDLEELVNRIKWYKRILESNPADIATSSWEFVEDPSPSS